VSRKEYLQLLQDLCKYKSTPGESIQETQKPTEGPDKRNSMEEEWHGRSKEELLSLESKVKAFSLHERSRPRKAIEYFVICNREDFKRMYSSMKVQELTCA